ncbi:MAG: hypothetical protein QOG19_3009, partial [Mycobacterium sp.]|nr:hypothetical protein [Mycobacterium sp.]
MPRALEHGDRCGALDLHVLEEAQVREATLRGESDTQPVRPDSLRGSDQKPVDV